MKMKKQFFLTIFIFFFIMMMFYSKQYNNKKEEFTNSKLYELSSFLSSFDPKTNKILNNFNKTTFNMKHLSNFIKDFNEKSFNFLPMEFQQRNKIYDFDSYLKNNPQNEKILSSNFRPPCETTKCWNGGKCDRDTHLCTCPEDFTNSHSSHINRPGCDMKSCGKDRGKNIGKNRCECKDGWKGPNCEICKNDLACKNYYKDQNATCDSSFLISQNKHFHCGITDDYITSLIGTNVTLQCHNMSFTEHSGYCAMQSWTTESPEKPKGLLTEVLYCDFYECKGSNIPGEDDKILYKCLHSSCNCTYESELCNVFVKFIVDSMTGWCTVTCDDKTKTAVFTHEQFPGNVPLDCIEIGECVHEQIHRPPPIGISQFFTFVFIGIGIFLTVVILISTFLAFIISCIQRWMILFEYKNKLKDKPLGGRLEFKDICYDLPDEKKSFFSIASWFEWHNCSKRILNKLSHTIQEGTMLALLGPSGAGKTTLLDILAGRVKAGKVSGKVFLNGKRIWKQNYERFIGYVSQEDLLMPTLTVRECIQFAADLKLPVGVSRDEKKERVDKVIKELGLKKVQNRRIGNALNRGISGGEKKRVSIGMEIVHEPHILFLDEPTSGLDAFNAIGVVKILKKMALKKGRTIIFSIHQPRAKIWRLFDGILLLNGGYIAYAGKQDKALSYFEKLGKKCPSFTNPADFLVDQLAKAQELGNPLKFEKKKYLNLKKNIDKNLQIQTEINTIENEEEIIEVKVGNNNNNNNNNKFNDNINGINNINQEKKGFFKKEKKNGYGSFQLSGDEEENEENEFEGENVESVMFAENIMPYASSFLQQTYYLSLRTFKNFIRNFFLLPAHVLSSIFLGFLLGIVYQNLDKNLSGCQNRMGSIFFMCCLMAFTAMSSLELFIGERAVYVSERANGYYYSISYFISKIIFDIIPLRIVPPVLMGSIAYPLIGLRPVFTHFLVFIGLLILFNLCAGSMCILIGTLSNSVGSANVITTILILVGSLFGGFLLNKQHLPPFLTWMNYLSFWNYAIEALFINEFLGMEIVIDPKGMPAFHGDGLFILNNLYMDKDRFYIDVIMMGVFTVVFILLSGLSLHFVVKEKR